MIKICSSHLKTRDEGVMSLDPSHRYKMAIFYTYFL